MKVKSILTGLVFVSALFQIACTPPNIVNFQPLIDDTNGRRSQPADFYEGPVDKLLMGDYMLIGYIDFQENIRKCYKNYGCEDVKADGPSKEDLAREAADRGGDYVVLLDDEFELEEITKSICTDSYSYSYTIDGKTYYKTACTSYAHYNGYMEIKHSRALIWRYDPEHASAEKNNKAINKVMKILETVYESSPQEDKTTEPETAAGQSFVSRFLESARKSAARFSSSKDKFLEMIINEDVKSIASLKGNPEAKKWRDDKGRTLLINALVLKKHRAATALIQAGLYNGKDQNNNDAIIYAAESGRLKHLKMLAARGQEITTVDHEGRNLALSALHNSNNNVLYWLLKQGINPRESGLEDIGLLHAAAYLGNLNAMKLLIRGYGLTTDERSGKSRKTPLMYAAEGGRINIIDFLLENKARIDLRDIEDNTALHYGAKANQRRAIRSLIRHGADPDVSNSKGYTPLLVAITLKNWRCAELLLEPTERLETAKKNNDKILTYLIKNHRAEFLNKVIKHYKKAIDKKTLQRVLLSAAAKGDRESIHVLAENGAEINQPIDGMTPLMVASVFGNTDAIAALMELDADAEVRSPNGYTALMYATTEGHLDVVTQLRNAQVKH